jgi:phage baseplate assembly protein W
MATVTTNIAREYSDLDLNFTIHPVKKDINRHVGDMAVINSIKNLVLTNHYERPFQPDIGSNIRRLLFENMDTITASSIEREIEQTISNYEPRARVSRINAIADFNKNGFKVEMEFFVINRTDPITINFFLERTR